MSPLQLAREAIRREPRLTYFGLGVHDEAWLEPAIAEREFDRWRAHLLSHAGLLEVAMCAQWLRGGHASGERCSYGLKHEVENHFGAYVSNGALIAAALGLGLAHRVQGPNVVLDLAGPCPG